MAVEVFVPPSSSHVAEVAWDDESEDMIVTYTNDDQRYIARNIPRQTFRALTLAGSVGGFLNRQIKGLTKYNGAEE